MTDALWKNPTAFWLLWIIPVVALLAVYAHRRVVRAAHGFAGEVMTPRVMPSLSPAGRIWKTLLLCTGLALVVVALARPVWDVYYIKRQGKGLDLVVALDVSRSMLADDGGETRLDRARSAISWLAEEIPNDRVGLVCFAGETLQAVPLTLDRAFFDEALALARPEFVGRGGTALGPAMDEAMEMLDTSYDRDKLVLLVTDGDDQDSFPMKVAARLAKRKIRVLTLGIGRAKANEPLVLDGQVVRHKDGKPVMAHLNEKLLSDIALETEGMYVPPEEAHRLPELYRQYIEPLRKGDNEEMQEKHYHERYQWFLGPGLLLILLQAGRRPYPRRRQRTTRVPGVAVLLLCLLPFAFGCGERAAEEHLRAGVEALALGDAARALGQFQEAEKVLPEDPAVAFDIGCALQAQGEEEAARSAYARVFETGLAGLRARAYANLGLMEAQEVARRVAEGDLVRSRVQRKDVEDRAERALDMLQLARDLDPSLDVPARNQELLSTWLRIQRDRWAAADRAQRREKRRKLTGSAYLLALIKAEEEIRAGIGSRELLANLILDQRDIREDIDLAPTKMADQEDPVPEEFQAQVKEALTAAKPFLQNCEELLGEGSSLAATEELVSGARRLQRALVVWGDMAEVLSMLTNQQQGTVQVIEQLGQVESVPAGALQQVVAMQTETAHWIGLLLDRSRSPQSSEKWVSVFKDRAGDLLAKARAEGSRAAEKIEDDLPAAHQHAGTMLGMLQALAAEWGLSQKNAPDLARVLEHAQRDIHARAFLAWAPDGEPELAAPVPGLQLTQHIRLAYLKEALGKAFEEKARLEEPREGETPEEKEQREKQNERKAGMRATLEGQLSLATDYTESALQKLASKSDRKETLGSMALARKTLREIWVLLAPFEKLVEEAVKEQGSLERLGAMVKALVDRDPDSEKPAEAARQALPHAAKEQRLVSDLTEHLVMRRPLELKAIEAQTAEAASKMGAGGAPPPGEHGAIAGVLLDLDRELDPARDAARKAAEILEAGSRGSGDVSLVKRFTRLFGGRAGDAEDAEQFGPLVSAHPHQVHALKKLAEALRRLQEASMDLKQLAAHVLQTEDALIPFLREKAAGRDPEDAVGETIPWQPVRERHQGLASYVGRLGEALDQELERRKAAAAQANQGQAGDSRDAQMAEQMLRSLVTQLEGAFGRAQKMLAAEDAANGLSEVTATWSAARNLWMILAGLEEILERGVKEEAGILDLSHELTDREVEAKGSVPPDVRDHARSDQDNTRSMIPVLTAHVEALKEQAAQGAAQGGGGHGGQGAQGGGGGVDPETIALAEKNLPLVDSAMSRASELLGESRFGDAVPAADEARRLLEEILNKLRENQDKDDQQQQPQAPEQQLSEDEAKRLARAVRERNRKQQNPEKRRRKPVEKDW